MLDPLPCWVAEGLSQEEIQTRVAKIVDHIAAEAAEAHRRDGTQPSDPSLFLQVHPHQRPERTKRAPLPLVHASRREVRQRFREAYAIFLEAYASAAALLRAGADDAKFPEGSFPPGLPFVPLLEPG